jgi:hypothetical protein
VAGRLQAAEGSPHGDDMLDVDADGAVLARATVRFEK